MKFNLDFENLKNLDRNKIISNAIEFIKYIAKKVQKNNYYLNLELDELVSYGVLGLIESIERYDETKQNKFKTFAEFRIRGAMLDYIRSLDKTPRSIREKEKLIEKAKVKLEAIKGKKATDTEIANELGMDLNSYYKLLDKSDSKKIVNLEDYLENTYHTGKNHRFIVQNTPEEELSKEEKKAKLKEAIKLLSLKEQQVIDLYYNKELNLKEISYILQISESRISQINKKALEKLRNILFQELSYEDVV